MSWAVVSWAVDDLTTFGALLRDLARRHGTRPGIWFEDAFLSFGEIDRAVDGYARGMLAAGVRRGDTVAVLAGNRPEWLYVAFAAARIGAVCVPVNTWYRSEEIAFVLGHTGADLLFAVDRVLRQDFVAILGAVPGLPGGGPATGEQVDHGVDVRRVIALTPGSSLPHAQAVADFLAEGAAVAEADLAAAEAAVTEDDLLFILYTSGSTSDPKGVRLHHGPALVNDAHLGDRIGLEPTDRMALFVPLFYSAATVNALPAAWTHATCLVLIDAFEAGAALRAIEASAATALFAIGPMSRALVSHPDYPRRDHSTLRKGVTAFSEADKRVVNEVLGVRHCCAVYGLTESYGPFSITAYDDPLEAHLTTAGRPLPGWTWKVVDPGTDVEVAPGHVGELRIQGFVTSGYHRNPAATAAAFDDEGYYRTGDLVHFDPDGRLVFHSRIKEVIKTNGVTVAPQDVEQVIATHPDVEQAHVVGVPDERRGELVVAFVVAAAPLTAEDVKAHVAARAASFKVPAHVLLVDDADLPRTASQKVPKHLLRDRAVARLAQAPS